MFLVRKFFLRQGNNVSVNMITVLTSIFAQIKIKLKMLTNIKIDNDLIIQKSEWKNKQTSTSI